MSVNSEYTKYIVMVLIVIVGAYGVWSLYLNPSRPQGMEIRFPDNKVTVPMPSYLTFYDSSLPSDFNYSWALGLRAEFFVSVNVTEYSKSTTQEKTIIQFTAKNSVKNWLNTVQMPNIVRNMMKFILDMSLPEIGNRIKSGFYWGGGIGRSYVTYLFKQSMINPSDPFLSLTLFGEYAQQSSIVWEIVFKLPVTGTDYEVIFTRMPKT
jgi:hypothetical protein